MPAREEAPEDARERLWVRKGVCFTLQGHMEQPQGRQSAPDRQQPGTIRPPAQTRARGGAGCGPTRGSGQGHAPPGIRPGPALTASPGLPERPPGTLSIPRSSPGDMGVGEQGPARPTSSTQRPGEGPAHGPQLTGAKQDSGGNQKPPAWDHPLQGASRPEARGLRAGGWPALWWPGCPPHERLEASQTWNGHPAA